MTATQYNNKQILNNQNPKATVSPMIRHKLYFTAKITLNVHLHTY